MITTGQRTHDLGDLVANVDIADRLGISPSAVVNWRNRHADFPHPVVVVARSMNPLFSWAEVKAWAIGRMAAQG